MRIGMILNAKGGFPPDIRVEKEVHALSRAGYDVFILVPKNSQEALEVEYIDAIGATVVRLPLSRQKSGKWNIRTKVKNLIHRWTMYDTRWVVPVEHFIRKFQIDVLHVHDFLLVPTILKIAKRNALEVIADLHENMPAAIKSYQTQLPIIDRYKQFPSKIYQFLKYHESRTLKKCLRVIIVVPEAGERLLSYGVLDNRLVIVSNTEDQSTFLFEPKNADSEILDKYEGYWVASYIGGIGPHRGVDKALEATALVKLSIPNFKLLIVGARDESRAWIETEIERLEIENHVDVIGWQPFSKVNSYVMASDICLVPHNDFEHTHTTVPHKLFQYMICGKPVLVSNCRPLARIVRDSNGGRIFQASDSRSLAEELIWMYRHSDTLTSFGEQGQEAALNRYAWRHDAQRLIDMYDNLKMEIAPNKA